VVNEKARYLSQDAADVALKKSIAQHTIRKAREYPLERHAKLLGDHDIAAALLYDPCTTRLVMC
jgi:hypothetical protein